MHVINFILNCDQFYSYYLYIGLFYKKIIMHKKYIAKLNLKLSHKIKIILLYEKNVSCDFSTWSAHEWISCLILIPMWKEYDLEFKSIKYGWVMHDVLIAMS